VLTKIKNKNNISPKTGIRTDIAVYLSNTLPQTYITRLTKKNRKFPKKTTNKQ